MPYFARYSPQKPNGILTICPGRGGGRSSTFLGKKYRFGEAVDVFVVIIIPAVGERAAGAWYNDLAPLVPASMCPRHPPHVWGVFYRLGLVSFKIRSISPIASRFSANALAAFAINMAMV